MNYKETFPLHIHLQDGFKDDTIILELNNEEVLRQEKITTDLRTAIAKRFITSVTKGRVNVKVEIPSLKLVSNSEIMVDSEIYLGISITEPRTPNRKIEFFVSKERFTYY